MAVGFGTPVVNNMSSRASFTLVFGAATVTSGQPIWVARYSWETGGISSITDNFSTPYTWTSVESKVGGSSTRIDLYIGTGGAGTAGTITVNGANNTCGGVAIPCTGATNAAALAAVDSHTNATATSTSAAITLTPSTTGQGIIAMVGTFIASASPLSPWTNQGDITVTGTVQSSFATYPNPPASGQTATWTGGSAQWGTVGAVVIAAQAPANTVAPAATGTGTVGQTLSCTTGTWTGDATIVYTYQWQRNTVDIGSATNNTYVLAVADAGKSIRCVVTATNSVSAVTANSNAISVDALVSASEAQVATNQDFYYYSD